MLRYSAVSAETEKAWDVKGWRNVFLTGRRGVGKSTIIRNAMAKWEGAAGGYIVEKGYDTAERPYFEMVNLHDRKRSIIAYSDSVNWFPVPRTFDSLGVIALLHSVGFKDLTLMDELGFFELSSQDFLKTVVFALDSAVPVLGVIKEHNNWFLNGIRNRKDLNVINVTAQNRDSVLEHVISWLKCLAKDCRQSRD